jgi:diguanylate cyclase (GGDEF)-like protein
MAASDSHPPSQPDQQDLVPWLDAPAVEDRLIEEIKRAERQGTALSALLVVIDNLQEMALEHGGELREQTLNYIAGALAPELRGFDRVGRPSERELLVLLPGADGPRGEIVARRVLDRVSTIKIEAEGSRRTLRFSVGMATWRGNDTSEELLARTRAAARGEDDEEYSAITTSPPPVGRERE